MADDPGGRGPYRSNRSSNRDNVNGPGLRGGARGGGDALGAFVPPQNIEAEQSTLGAMLLQRAAIEKAAEILEKDDFYRDAHQTLFEAITSLAQRDEPVDLITVQEELRNRDRLESIGGLPYLTALFDTVPTAANVEYYAKIVQEKAILRRLITAAFAILGMARGEIEDINETIDQAEREVFNVSQQRTSQYFTPLHGLLLGVYDRAEVMLDMNEKISGLSTGIKDFDSITSGLQNTDLIIIAARPSMGKCLTAGSLIDDPATGERLTIEECVRRQLPTVLGLSETGAVRPAAVSAWVDSGVKPCFRVRTCTGRAVEVTGHHPFLTVDGWTPLHDLGVGSMIAVPRRVPAFGAEGRVPLDLVRLMAYFIAEGGLTSKSPRFTNTDPAIVGDFRAIIGHHYPECVIRRRDITYSVVRPARSGWKSSPNPVTQWLRALGLWGKSSEERSFPDCVWRWPEAHLAEFLRVLMSCNGTLCAMQGYPRIEFAVASQALAEDVHHALTRFGIVSKLWRKTPRCWRVEITEPQSVAIHQEKIGWVGEKAACCAETLDDSSLKRPAGPDIYWDEIVAIEPVGRHRVYDLSVPEGANFIAQDICVHNTSLCLSVAEHVALKEHKPVAIFSLEMSAPQLAMRMLCSQGQINAHKLRTGRMNEEEWSKLANVVQSMYEAPIFIDDATETTALTMRAKCRRLMADQGLGLVVVDYLQLMRSHRRTENRVQEIGEIARGLKSLARELKVPVIALSQLSRAVESRENKRPMLSDLRECVVGETRVVDAVTGRLVPIREVRAGDEVLALGERQRLGAFPVSDVWSTGVKPVFTLTTRTGRVVTATANHPFLTAQGWRRLDGLGPGDIVATAMRLPNHGTEDARRADLCRLLGYLVGDGTCQKHRAVGFCGSDPAVAADAIAIVRRCFPGVEWRQRKAPGQYQEGDLTAIFENGRGEPFGNPLREWLRGIGIFGQKDSTKSVPSWVFEAGEVGAREFLAGYLSADGSVKKARGRGGFVHFDTVSRRLAEDVQMLLLRLGVVATVSDGHQSAKAAPPLHRIAIADFADNLRTFVAQVTPAGRKGRLLQQMLDELPPGVTSGSLFGLPPEISGLLFEKTKHLRQQGRGPADGERLYGKPQGKRPRRDICAKLAEQLKDEVLGVWAHSDLLWEEIKSIAPAGEQEVFDISVPGCANFLANGIVAHNSGSIEAEADMVCFLYREAYYKMKEAYQTDGAERPEREPVEETEIIIGKHRNGPTGMVKVGFMPDFAKFVDLALDRPDAPTGF